MDHSSKLDHGQVINFILYIGKISLEQRPKKKNEGDQRCYKATQNVNLVTSLNHGSKQIDVAERRESSNLKNQKGKKSQNS